MGPMPDWLRAEWRGLAQRHAESRVVAHHAAEEAADAELPAPQHDEPADEIFDIGPDDVPF
jgi:hypothetical protein